MDAEFEKSKSQLLARKQALFNRLLSGLLTGPATKVRKRLAACRRRALQIENDLAKLEEQERSLA